MEKFTHTFNNFTGTVSNKNTEGVNGSKRILNFEIHKKPGVLTLRPKYMLKYEAPSINDEVLFDRIKDLEYITFENFADKSIENQEMEVTCEIQKGEITALDGSGIEDTIPTLLFWIRPYFRGYWIDGWEWLNKIVITKTVSEPDETYKSKIDIYGELGDIRQWTVYNKTKGNISQVIDYKEAEGGNTTIHHTLFNNNWEDGDIIYLFKNYFSSDFMNYNFIADEYEINFHTVVNDLRISFGSEKYRLAAGIGYRNKYFKVKGFGFSVHPDIDNEETLTNFSNISRIIFDPYTLYPGTGEYGLKLVKLSNGNLPAGDYQFKLIGVIDSSNKLLLAENKITVSGSYNIAVYPYARLGNHNKRITDLEVYFSSDGKAFYLFNNYNISETEFSPTDYIINEDGQLILESVDSIELYTNEDAASKDSETDSVGLWKIWRGTFLPGTVESVNDGYESSYSIKYTNRTILPYETTGIQHEVYDVKELTDYTITFDAKSDIYRTLELFFLGNSYFYVGQPKVVVDVKNIWTNIQITLTTPKFTSEIYKYLVIIANDLTSDSTFQIDNMSIKEKSNSILTDDTAAEESIKSRLGYTPTKNIVSSWDQALILNGKTFLVNPVIDEERFINYIFRSHISSDSVMYDVITSQNRINLEKFDGDFLVGVFKTNEKDLAILKNNSVTIIDPETGYERLSDKTIGCISKASIQNNFWCDKQDAFGIINGTITNLTEDTIRDKLNNSEEKEKIYSVIDRYGTYRIRLYDINTEWIYTKLGWIEQSKDIFPKIYREGVGRIVWFMDEEGNIYSEPETIEEIIGYGTKYGAANQEF
ncbi:MAG: hypothetical protein PVH88_02150 [Ignavibacteria bacterium]|jgi:hypothetical protein